MSPSAPRVLVLVLDDPTADRNVDSMRWPLYRAYEAARGRGQSALRDTVAEMSRQPERHAFRDGAGMLLDAMTAPADTTAQDAAIHATLEVLMERYGSAPVQEAMEGLMDRDGA